jgi:cellulose synthase/poly-beta-1,6-N-acetylglucosamine synthase-like glycosyltransferase
MWQLLFWISFLVGVYPYAIYPLLAATLARIRPRPVCCDAITPSVTVVISAYNEAQHIEATVRNKLDQDYPPDLLDVMLASDGSTDGTDGILERLAKESTRVTYFRQEPRRGKTAALNSLLERTKAEVVVFSDANSMYRTDTVRALVRNFSDPSVGYVTGRMLYVNPDGSLVGDGCSAFMRYENALRAIETRLGSIVGVDGGVDAVRRNLYRAMRPDQLPDFVLPLDVVQQGYRTVFDPQAILTEDTLTTGVSEYRMRVRVALRAFWALWDKRELLNPFRAGVFAWQLWSHKMLRYMSFLPLAVAVLLSLSLMTRGGLYAGLAVAEGMFGVLVLTALLGPQTIARSAPSRYCFYFALINWASAVAFVRFVRGQKQVLWQPRMG